VREGGRKGRKGKKPGVPFVSRISRLLSPLFPPTGSSCSQRRGGGIHCQKRGEEKGRWAVLYQTLPQKGGEGKNHRSDLLFSSTMDKGGEIGKEKGARTMVLRRGLLRPYVAESEREERKGD